MFLSGIIPSKDSHIRTGAVRVALGPRNRNRRVIVLIPVLLPVRGVGTRGRVRRICSVIVARVRRAAGGTLQAGQGSHLQK